METSPGEHLKPGETVLWSGPDYWESEPVGPTIFVISVFAAPTGLFLAWAWLAGRAWEMLVENNLWFLVLVFIALVVGLFMVLVDRVDHARVTKKRVLIATKDGRRTEIFDRAEIIRVRVHEGARRVDIELRCGRVFSVPVAKDIRGFLRALAVPAYQWKPKDPEALELLAKTLGIGGLAIILAILPASRFLPDMDGWAGVAMTLVMIVPIILILAFTGIVAAHLVCGRLATPGQRRAMANMMLTASETAMSDVPGDNFSRLYLLWARLVNRVAYGGPYDYETPFAETPYEPDNFSP